MKRAVAFLFLAVIAASCTKTINTTEVVGAAKPSLVVVPSELHGSEYVAYSFKARVNGFANSDVYLDWDFGPTVPTSPYTHYSAEYTISNVVFTRAGTFPVSVKAYDSFNDTLIDSYSFSAVIDSTVPKVTLSPRSFDSTIFTNLDGSIPTEGIFSASVVGSPYGFNFIFHITGPGIDSTALQPYSVFGVRFNHVGSYHVVVTALDGHGQYYASDSVDARYSLMKPDLFTLQSSRFVDIVIVPDAKLASQIVSGGIQVLSKEMKFVSSPGQYGSWSGNSFTMYYLKENTRRNGYDEHSRDSVFGTLSTDLQTITSLDLRQHDIEYQLPSYEEEGFWDWGGVANNLMLFSITPTEIVYVDTASTVADMISNFYFITGNTNTNGNPTDMSVYSEDEHLPGLSTIFPIAGGNPRVPSIFVIFKQ
ncbi:MAG TPA: hypothetical protein VEW28_01885 [Candidatus Kapabacteria bacterium]|nr:hypothetical protein [Candidatus Kapabacteria bacterium]HYM35184.1 hypothetical protein [Steroidobacteraceae bacterium]